MQITKIKQENKTKKQQQQKKKQKHTGSVSNHILISPFIGKKLKELQPHYSRTGRPVSHDELYLRLHVLTRLSTSFLYV